MNNCPICDSDQVSQIDKISIERVIEGYKTSNLNIDIRHLLPPGDGFLHLLKCQSCDAQWFQPMSTGDDELYAELQKHNWYYQNDKPEHAHAAKLIAPGSRVLEVGCGSGAFAAYLDPSISYRGIEFNDGALARARRAGLDVTMKSIEAIAEEQPKAYDVVCHFQVMEHVSDVPKFMRACVGALRDGGLLLVSVPADDSFLRIAAASWLNMPPHHVTRWSDRALRNLLSNLGVGGVDLWHEDVAQYHKKWYEATMATFALAGVENGRPILDDNKIRYRLARRAARAGFLKRLLLWRGESIFPYSGRGHSVTIWGTEPLASAAVRL